VGRSGDGLFLQLRREVHEELTETGNTNHEVTVLAGILLCRAEHPGVNRLDLQRLTAAGEIESRKE